MSQPALRPVPPWAGDEKSTLVGFLEFHRATMRWKCAGLTPEQLIQRSAHPSSLCLLGLLRHLTEVESRWLRYRFAGQPEFWRYSSEDNADGDLEVTEADTESVAASWARYDLEVSRSRAIIDGAELDQLAIRPAPEGELPSLRWILVHLIEEYARHNGHADLLREAIDGTTGE
jgi:uncharacterized protein DUF664